MDNDLVDILLDLKADGAATRAMVEGLAGPDGRIKKLEDADRRQWWITVAIAPFLTLAHATARKFGVQI